MTKLVVAAVLVAAAMPACAGAPAGVNPGTVVSNVLQNPPPGCVYGFGYVCNSAPGRVYYDYAPHYGRHHSKAASPRG